MKRPSFQFYPGDWWGNAKLRRCSHGARGAWIDLLCRLHDSDEYGVCRWPLRDLANAAGAPIVLVRELVSKDVLKGADKDSAPYVYTPRHAGKDGTPVTLVDPGSGPCWYSSRMVRDEWVRQRRGAGSRFDRNESPMSAPNSTPEAPIGEQSGDGSSSSSSSSSSKKRGSAARRTGLPSGFCVSERVRNWATEHSWEAFLDAHFEHFLGSVRASGKTYLDWDEAFMGYIRGDYGDIRAKLQRQGMRPNGAHAVLHADEQFRAES